MKKTIKVNWEWTEEQWDKYNAVKLLWEKGLLLEKELEYFGFELDT